LGETPTDRIKREEKISMRKMTSRLILGSILGLIIGLIISPQIEKLLSSGSMVVKGNLTYASAGDPSASGRDPEGYYVTARTRFYIDTARSDLVGKVVSTKGALKIICGSDLYPCYPLIQAKSVAEVIDR
jgi:hypothetical protein